MTKKKDPEVLELRRLLKLHVRGNGLLLEALKMYADPGFYHAILIRGDPPTGGFDKDTSKIPNHPHYDRRMPGKLARQTLAKFRKQYAALFAPPKTN